MSKRFHRTVVVLACVALGSGASALGSIAMAHEVPNEANWHIHDGTGPGPLAGSHHAGLAFFPALFAQEGLVYGTAEAPYVRCPNATDKAGWGAQVRERSLSSWMTPPRCDSAVSLQSS